MFRDNDFAHFSDVGTKLKIFSTILSHLYFFTDKTDTRFQRAWCSLRRLLSCSHPFCQHPPLFPWWYTIKKQPCKLAFADSQCQKINNFLAREKIPVILGDKALINFLKLVWPLMNKAKFFKVSICFFLSHFRFHKCKRQKNTYSKSEETLKKGQKRQEKVQFKFPFLLICHGIPFCFSICYLSTFSGLFFKCDKNAKKIRKKGKYHKIASSNTSRLEAQVGFFRMLMKGIFGPYVLWPLDKKLIFWIVTRVSARDYTVFKFYIRILEKF